MFTDPTVDVLVVGAGPAGLLTTCGLRKAGVNPFLIEQSSRTSAHAYSALLHSETVDALDTLGIGVAIRERGLEIRRIQINLPAGEIIDLELDRNASPIVALPQSSLEEILLSALQEAGSRVHWDHELTDLGETKGLVAATVAEHGEVPQGYPVLALRRLVIREHCLKTRWIVGADGYHSTVRRMGGFGIDHSGAARRFWFFEAEAEGALEPLVRLWINEDGVAALWPLGGRSCRWTFESSGSIGTTGAEAVLRSLVRRRAPGYTSGIAEIKWSAGGLFESRLCSVFRKGRHVIVSDAAHLGDPIGTQSMNAGLQEAVDLVGRLAGLLNGTYDEKTLDQYSTHSIRRWKNLTCHDLKWCGEVPAWAADSLEPLLRSLPASGEPRNEFLRQLGLAPPVAAG